MICKFVEKYTLENPPRMTGKAAWGFPYEQKTVIGFRLPDYTDDVLYTLFGQPFIPMGHPQYKSNYWLLGLQLKHSLIIGGYNVICNNVFLVSFKNRDPARTNITILGNKEEPHALNNAFLGRISEHIKKELELMLSFPYPVSEADSTLLLHKGA